MSDSRAVVYLIGMEPPAIDTLPRLRLDYQVTVSDEANVAVASELREGARGACIGGSPQPPG
jgi:hypothetical protein